MAKTPHCPICENTDTALHITHADMLIYRCKACGMMFQDYNLIKGKNFDQTYAQNPHYLRAANSIAAGVMNRLGEKFGGGFKNLTILEIGTGSGALAASLTANGTIFQGIEPSNFFYRYSLERFPILNGIIENCSLEKAHLEKAKFDLIIMVDTLEHIPAPVLFLKIIKSYLKPSGFLYIEVPNEASLKLKGLIRKLFNFYSRYPTHEGHINLFTGKTLSITLLNAGFSFQLDQFSILDDYERMKIVFQGRFKPLALALSLFFKLSKLDIVLRQGNLSAGARIAK